MGNKRVSHGLSSSVRQESELATYEASCAQDAHEVILVDAAAELLSWTAQIDNARRRALFQLGQQQLRQEHRTEVVGPKGDLHSDTYFRNKAEACVDLIAPLLLTV